MVGGGGLELVVVVVAWWVVVVGCVVVWVVAVAVVAVGVVGALFWQSRTARSLIVEAPWVKLDRTVLLTVWGRPATAVAKLWLAFWAALQLWDPTAEAS